MVALLGAGGMAEVYRARDARLGRDIALKVVNEALAGDPDLIRRFEQEARLAGSLNHPNLVAVYEFGQHEGGAVLRHRAAHGRVTAGAARSWAAPPAHRARLGGTARARARGCARAPCRGRLRANRVSATALDPFPSVGVGPIFHVSQDGLWAAALEQGDLVAGSESPKPRLVVVSLEDGSTRLVWATNEGLVPRGWSADGTVWVSRAISSVGEGLQLRRVDPTSGKVLEERTIPPADPGDPTRLASVVLSPDGRHVVFSYKRYSSSLYIVRGLGC